MEAGGNGKIHLPLGNLSWSRDIHATESLPSSLSHVLLEGLTE